MTMIQFLQQNKLLRQIIYKIGSRRARSLISDFEHHISTKDKILDIGSGTCIAASLLQNKGYNIYPLDICNISFVDQMAPVIYDGRRMPFADDEFDVALILTVLHHLEDHEELINEAKRVAKKIIIVEDIFNGWWHKQITFFLDSLLNLEFIGHPHSNRSDSGWRNLFKRLGLELLESTEKQIFFIFRLGYYFLSKEA